MSKYEFVSVLDRANIEDYLKLFEASYGQNSKLTADYLRWLYEANPHGRAVGVDAYFNGELAAHYATIPRVYRVGADDILGLLSVNTATHPSHQRNGLFTRLATATFEQASQEGYQYVVGIANAQSIKGFLNKLEFEHLGQVGLALGRRPPTVPLGYSHLEKNKDWMSWRLANPSSGYFLTAAGNDEAIVNTRRGRAVFSIGRVKISDLPDNCSVTPWSVKRRFATLTPVYPREGNGFLLPKRLMPSPWHIILRRLGVGLDSMTKIHFDGLSMDTF
jgi:GNAT superfamily N-acetyltransferase